MNKYYAKEIQEFLENIENVDVVSFDIFDTLLIRPYNEPFDLFTHLEKKLDLPGYRRERILSEIRARYRNTSSEDVVFDEIYDEIQEKYKNLKEEELSLEKLILSAHPVIKELYTIAIEKNKKIIATSDMYLPKLFLKTLLDKNGYNINNIYVSSEIKKCKNTGNLYKHIINDLKISPSKILHIGDNLISDYIRAREAGLKALHIKDYITKFNQTLWGKRFKLLNKTQNSLDFSILKALIAQYIIFNNKDYWQNFSYILGGSLALAYIQFIKNRALFFGIEQLLFVSRDGYLLEEIYKLYKNSSVKTRYIYAPRIFNLKCFCDFRNNRDYFNTIVDLIEKAGYNLDTSSVQTCNMEDFYQKNYKIFENFAQKNKNEYKKYLKELGIEKKPSAIIDGVTGAFSSLAFLKKFLKQDLKLGFFICNFAESNEFIFESFFNTLKYSKNEFIVSIWELLLTSPEPPITDIRDCQPIYSMINDAIQARLDIFQKVEQSVLEFSEKYLRYFNDKNIVLSSSLIKELYKIYEQTLTTEDKKELSTLTCAGDVCNSNYVPIYPNMNILQRLINYVIRIFTRGKNFCKKRLRNIKIKIKSLLYKYIKQ